MRIAVITNSSSYEPRAFLTADFFTKQGHEVIMVLSDFIHREKLKRNTENDKIVYVNTISYYRNLSIRRIYSHFDFSRKVYHLLKHMDLDLIYVLIPANSLLKYTSLYKRKANINLIVDILDLWPESLPIPIPKTIWPLNLWGDLRNRNLKNADLIITECKLFEERLSPFLKDRKVINVYWPRMYEQKDFLTTEKPNDEICFCYLGSINHIIDMVFLTELLTCIKRDKRVTLHVIGDGECRQELLEKLEKAEINTVYYGAIYDEAEKMRIMSKCHYGLNIMKTSVCAGVTMKSVDYMYAGLSLINNIRGDIWNLVEDLDIGFNCDYKMISNIGKEIADKFISINEQLRVRECYLNNFSNDAYSASMKQCMKIISELQES